jgi:hypothetical protein
VQGEKSRAGKEGRKDWKHTQVCMYVCKEKVTMDNPFELVVIAMMQLHTQRERVY